jgi:hypothetical protein
MRCLSAAFLVLAGRIERKGGGFRDVDDLSKVPTSHGRRTYLMQVRNAIKGLAERRFPRSA